MPRKSMTETETEAVEFTEPLPTLPAEVAVIVMQPARRLVKLADAPTMYLVEDGVRHAVATSGAAVSLGIAPEVVDDLSEWPEGDKHEG